MNFTKSDIAILSQIEREGGVNKLQSVTVHNIIEKSGLSATKVRATLKLLADANYIEDGYMQKNAKTYYITDAGIKFLQELGCPVVSVIN